MKDAVSLENMSKAEHITLCGFPRVKQIQLSLPPIQWHGAALRGRENVGFPVNVGGKKEAEKSREGISGSNTRHRGGLLVQTKSRYAFNPARVSQRVSISRTRRSEPNTWGTTALWHVSVCLLPGAFHNYKYLQFIATLFISIILRQFLLVQNCLLTPTLCLSLSLSLLTVFVVTRLLPWSKQGPATGVMDSINHPTS